MAAPQKTLISSSSFSLSSNTTSTSSIKFLCSYGGKILPRPSDGRLRYIGGVTRVVSVTHSVTFSVLMNKLNELCGYPVSLRCQLPTEDLDVLVSVKSDEELANVLEEYDKASLLSKRELKIRAILSPPKSSATNSPVNSSQENSSPSSSNADLSPSNSDHIRSLKKSAIRRFEARNSQYGVVSGRCYYPCHLQANYRRSSFFPQYSNHFWH